MDFRFALGLMFVWAITVWFVVTDERKVCEMNHSPETCVVALR